jgi:hypothetical protein
LGADSNFGLGFGPVNSEKPMSKSADFSFLFFLVQPGFALVVDFSTSFFLLAMSALTSSSSFFFFHDFFFFACVSFYSFFLQFPAKGENP